MSNLIVRNADIGTKSYPLDASKTYAIGRFSGDITMEYEPKCSPRHATLKFDGTIWRLVDEMSDAGTEVDGRQVNFAEMRDGVVAKIGDTELSVGLPQPQVVEPETAPEPAPTPAPKPKAKSAPKPKPIADTPKKTTGKHAPVKKETASVKGRAYAAAPKAKASVATSPANTKESSVIAQVEVAGPKERSGKTLGAESAAGGRKKKKDPALVFLTVALGAGLIALAVYMIVMTTGGSSIQDDDAGTTVIRDARRSETDAGKAAAAFTKAKRIESPRHRLAAFMEMEKGLASSLIEEMKADYQHELMIARKELKKEVHASLSGYLIRADRAFPFDENSNAEFLKVREAFAEIEELQAEIARYKESDEVISWAIDELKLERDAKKRIALYNEKSAIYFDKIKLQARRFELMALYSVAADILVEGVGRVLLSEEDEEAVRAQATALTLRRAPKLDDWISDITDAANDQPKGSVVKKDPIIPTPVKPDEKEPDSGPKDPDSGETPPVKIKEEKPVAPMPVQLTFFPNNAEEEAKIVMALRKALILALSREGYEAKAKRFDGGYYKVLRADDTGIIFEIKREEVPMAWAEVPIPLFAMAVSALKIDQGAGAIAMAAMAATGGEFEIAGTLLASEIEARKGDETGAFRKEAEIYYAARVGKALPADGLVIFKKRLMFPEEKANIERLAEIPKLLKKFKSALRLTSKKAPEKQTELYEGLKGLGEEAVMPTLELIIESREKAMESATKTTGLGKKNVKQLDELKKELHKRRKHALELIFDTAKWPYPYGPDNAEVTQEVLKRVAAVREIWENPASVKGRSSSKATALFEKIRRLNEWMDELDPAREHHKSDAEEDIEYLNSIANQALNVKNHGVDGKERSFITKAKKIMDENTAIAEKFKGDATAPDPLAWEQLRITNDYRFMMGRLPMKMSFKLYWGAKHHSRWCIEHNGGRIAHDSPGGARGNNPSQRAAFEGYSGGVGENIHMSGAGPTPLSAHNSWLTSSGHHRNILNAGWIVMGNGKHQTIWTQKFGASDEGKGNQESKGGK